MLNEIIGLSVMQMLLFVIFLTSTAQIDAHHLDRQNWIPKKTYRNIQRVCAMVAITFVSYIPFHFLCFLVLWAALFSPTLNYLRRNIDDIWYMGTENSWDIFWNKHKRLYKAFVFTAIPTALYFYIWAWDHYYANPY